MENKNMIKNVIITPVDVDFMSLSDEEKQKWIDRDKHNKYLSTNDFKVTLYKDYNMIKYESHPISLKVMRYNKEKRTWTCMKNNITNDLIEVDLIADASFHEEYKDLIGDDFEKYCESFIGKNIKCEALGSFTYYTINAIK